MIHDELAYLNQIVSDLFIILVDLSFLFYRIITAHGLAGEPYVLFGLVFLVLVNGLDMEPYLSASGGIKHATGIDTTDGTTILQNLLDEELQSYFLKYIGI